MFRRKTALLETILLLISVPVIADAKFSESFSRYLREKFGPGIETALTRADMGDGASYGGGDHVAGTKTKSPSPPPFFFFSCFVLYARIVRSISGETQCS